MSQVQIDETCSCGSTFRFRGDRISAEFRTRNWREEHKHAESVGICGDDTPNLIGGMQQYCALNAGHPGMHSDGEGCHWGTREQVMSE